MQHPADQSFAGRRRHEAKLQPLKADQPVAVVKEEEKVAVKRKREDSEEGGRQPNKQRSKNVCKMPTYSYKKREDGRPPEMSQLHVDFALISVEYLC